MHQGARGHRQRRGCATQSTPTGHRHPARPGWGKARQPHGGEDGGGIQVIIRQIVSHDEEEPLLLEHEALEK
jgi:hypothetical protein